MFLLKLFSLLLICAVSVFAAVHFTDTYVAQTAASAQDKSLTETLIEIRLREALREAEERAMAELREANITIVTETLETKPPVIEPPKETAPPETEPQNTEPPLTEPPETTYKHTEATLSPPEDEGQRIPPTEFRRGGLLPEDRSNIRTRSLLTLSKAENERMMEFLIEHYFLDGYAYAHRETHPELRAKKHLAAEMQGYITDSLNLVMSFLDVSNPTAILNADFSAIITETESIKAEFAAEFAQAKQHGEEFERVYDAGIAYFDRLIEALNAIKTEADNFASASNPLVAALLLASAVDSVLLPEIFDTLESSYDITEICQEIFLEGTQGAWLLTRDEVIEVFLNPGLALG